MDLTIDATALAPMLGRMDVYGALLDSLNERRGAHEGASVLRLRLSRALQGHDLTVRLANADQRVPAELQFIQRTLAEVHPRANLRLMASAVTSVPAAVAGAGPAARAPPSQA